MKFVVWPARRSRSAGVWRARWARNTSVERVAPGRRKTRARAPEPNSRRNMRSGARLHLLSGRGAGGSVDSESDADQHVVLGELVAQDDSLSLRHLEVLCPPNAT